jgi:cohesin complex subunit SCC1
MQLPSDIGLQPEEEEVFSPVPDNFDDTTIPIYHPAESGPISLGTKHAVHLLREQFGPEAEESESIRQKNTIIFQELLPEAQTSRADATKMFFEVLVLATKDAIKVEQPGTALGGPLRIRAKRGLWGQWAETAASGELASQSQAAPQGTAMDAPAEGILAGPAQVSVSA